MKELYHCTPISNMESILKEGLIPQVGVRSAKLNESPGVFLFESYGACEDALMNWLGEEFDELDAEPVTLKITLPEDFPLEEAAGFEKVSMSLISPEYISFYKFEGEF